MLTSKNISSISSKYDFNGRIGKMRQVYKVRRDSTALEGNEREKNNNDDLESLMKTRSNFGFRK